MKKKVAVIAILSTVALILGGLNSTLLYTTQYLKTKEAYTYQLDASVTWYDCNWSYAKEITIDSTKITSDQTNFPVLLQEAADSDLVTHAQSDGGDIVFVDRWNSSQYNHEIEKYDRSTGELIAWVNITSLSSTSDTILYMYYGNPTCANQWNITQTWGPYYILVQHLNESSGALEDSTSNNNDGTNIIREVNDV